MEANYTEFKEKFWALVSESNNILITSHISPDDDSISSVLSMYEIILQRFPEKKVRIAYSNERITQYESFTYFDKIEFVDDVANLVNEIDLLIVLDGSEYHRFSRMPEILQTASKSICIDHHNSPPSTFTLSLIIPTMPANGELIYRAFEGDYTITKSLAEAFLLGILGDTGNFRFLKPGQTETFLIAKKLLDILGVSIDSFRSRYGMMSKREFELLKEFIKNTQYAEISNWPPVQYSFVDKNTIAKEGYSDTELSAASSIYVSMYVRNIQGYTWGFTIKPKSTGELSLSFRSLPGSVIVRDLVERMGIGGGHDRACGGSFKNTQEVEEGIEKILTWMKDNAPLLG